MGQFTPIGDTDLHGMMRRLEMVELALTGNLQGANTFAFPDRVNFGEVPGHSDGQSANRIRAAKIRDRIRKRRARSRFFPDDLFADPAWDIMLDLFAAHFEGRQVSVSSLCIAAAVPATTALRWIKSMTEDGWLVRVADAQDGRRIFVKLSDMALNKLEAYFDEMD